MADITKCANKKCKIKEQCYRYTAKDGYWQSSSECCKVKSIITKEQFSQMKYRIGE